MLSCCQIHDRENYLRGLLLTAAAALPPEFLQQSEHQIEAMGHVEPGQPKMNPTYPTNLFNLITSCFCKGKDGGEQIPANTLMDEKLPRLMLNKLPRKASLSLLSLLAGPSVASNASTVIPDTACSWTFCPQSWEALTILGRRLSKSCLLERKVLNEKCNNQDFDIQLESNMHKRFNYKSYLVFFNLSQANFNSFWCWCDVSACNGTRLMWVGMKLRMG